MRRLAVILPVAIAGTLLVSSCGDSSSSGTSGTAPSTVPSGHLGTAPVKRGLVLDVANEHPYSATLAETDDPNRVKKQWMPNLGHVSGRSFELYAHTTTDTSKTMHFSWKTTTGSKSLEFTFSVTLSCSGTTCTATGKTTSSVPPELNVSIEKSSGNYLHPAPAGGTGVVAITVKSTS